MTFEMLNWPAVLAGTIAAFVLGMLWFSPKMFGRMWSTGSHDIEPPESPPLLAMALTLAGLFLLALLIGLTETVGAINAAAIGILAAAVLVMGMDLFSQKSTGATIVDGGYILASGLLMIVAQALF